MKSYRDLSESARGLLYSGLYSRFMLKIMNTNSLYSRFLIKENYMVKEIPVWEHTGYCFSNEELAVFDYVFTELARDPSIKLTADEIYDGVMRKYKVSNAENDAGSRKGVKSDKRLKSMVSDSEIEGPQIDEKELSKIRMLLAK